MDESKKQHQKDYKEGTVTDPEIEPKDKVIP